jgi:multidrug efflux system outer membrane protein
MTAAETPWREFFADPQLRSVIELALENNRDLQAAALTVERARAVYRIERSDLYPDVGASASAESFSFATDLSGSGESQTATFEQYSVSLGIASWELDFFGRIRSLKEAALQRYFGTREAHAAARIALISQVASAYLALAADTESLALAEATLEAQRQSYDLIRQSTDLGMTSELDLRQAQSQVDASRADVARLRGRVARGRNALGLLAGTQVPADLLPDGLDTVTEMGDLAPGLPSEVLLRRPDILAAEHRLQAANADIGAARAAFFPRIALTGSGGTLSGDLSGLFGSGTGVWSFVAGIDVPIFTGGALRAGLDASYVERDLAVGAYEKAIQTAFAEVSDALILRETLTDQQEAQESLVEALSEAHRLSKARYDVGVEGYLTVLVAERSLYSARQGLVAVRLADELNRVTLFKVLGGGASEEP